MKRLFLSLLITLGATQAFAQAVVPPATWQEHWFGHSEILYRMYYDNDVAIYYDSGVSPSITWPNALVGDVWRYTKSVYGDFGPENRVYGIFHSNSGITGGHPATWGDAHHDYRNAVDLGGSWASPTGWNLDATVHEVGHIVEGGSKGVLGSPSFPLWHDSKWMEIYQYDVYTHLGWTADATRWYNSMIQGSDDFPSPGSHWFRDWFYPIYSQHGGNQVLNKYFTLLSQYFPQSGNHYARDLNWGEFIHFWSGAAGVDLKPLATTAFGWTNEWETQYVKAKADFNFSAPPAGGPAGYTKCSWEDQICKVGGDASVAYGSGTSFVYKDISTSISCDNNAFGSDPAPNTPKACYYRMKVVGPAGYTACASENQTCSFTGKASVAYGANGVFNYVDATNSIVCSNGVFGDPLPNVAKSCFYRPITTPTGPAGYTACASENQTCSFSGKASVAYGANNVFNYLDATSSIVCGNTVFGDPLPGVVKSCFYKTIVASSSVASSVAVSSKPASSKAASSQAVSSQAVSSKVPSSQAASSKATSSVTGACANIPNYVDKNSYATGNIVQNNGSRYVCTEGGWCTIGGPYAPGVGWAWQYAWSLQGSCQ